MPIYGSAVYPPEIDPLSVPKLLVILNEPLTEPVAWLDVSGDHVRVSEAAVKP